MNLPSFLSSTLSLMALLSLGAIIAMIFLHIDPPKELLAALTGIISGYLGSRIPSLPTGKPDVQQG